MSELDRTILESDENKKVESLGEFMGIGRYGYGSMDHEQRAIFDKAQSAMLSIPGHARYYQEKIERTRELLRHYESLPSEEKRRMEEEYRERKENLSMALNYDSVRGEAFTILGLLPSAEAVAVLGHFLEDPEGRDGKDVLGNPIFTGSDMLPAAPNCGKAYYSLSKLIEHPPVPPTGFEDVELNQERADAWKQWWSEVKSGKRTYRFKGSPIEYGAAGPATKEQMEKLAKDRKRAADGPKGIQSSSTGMDISSRPPLIALVLAGLAVMASMIWYFRRVKWV